VAESEGSKNEGTNSQGNNTESAAHLSSMYIKDYGDTIADSKAYQQQREAGDAKVRQALYDAMEGRQQGIKSLRIPDGSWGKAHYVYPQKTHTGQGRSRYSGRSYGHKKTSSHTAHPTLHTPPHWSDTPYSKGNDGMNWWERFKQRWGLVW
jgi:hypothetical protein